MVPIMPPQHSMPREYGHLLPRMVIFAEREMVSACVGLDSLRLECFVQSVCGRSQQMLIDGRSLRAE